MCSICRCFGWMLDLLQRIITFILACIMSIAICIGMTLAIGAGVAYGYNFSLAEFLDFSRSDVTVYVRRGQFGDQPEIQPIGRRSGDDENEMFSSNFSVDYQDGRRDPVEGKPLADAWQRAQDSRSYAERLTKYSKIKSANMRSGLDDEEEITVNDAVNASERIDDEAVPNRPTLSTSLVDEPQSRKTVDLDDPPLYMSTPQISDATELNYNSEPKGMRRNFKKHRHKDKNPQKPNVKGFTKVADDDESFTHERKTLPNYYAEDIEYSNIFKPV